MGVDSMKPSSGEQGSIEQEVDACKQLVTGAFADAAGDGDASRENRTGVDALIAAERGPLAKLRALPVRLQMAAVLLLLAGLTVASVALTPRVDLTNYPVSHMSATLVLLFLVAAAAGWRLLRPLHAPPPSKWSGVLLVVVGVALPLLLAMVPIEHSGASAGQGGTFWSLCAKCFSFGLVFGVPVLLLAVAARRARVDGPAVAALAGIAAGLTGNLTLHMHCAITDVPHIMFGHVSLMVFLGLVAAGWHLIRTRKGP